MGTVHAAGATTAEPADESLAGVVDLRRYPLDDLDGQIARAVITAGRDGLRTKGMAALPGFLRADALPALVAEADGLAPLAHHSRVSGTAYLAPPDESFPADHPRRALWPTALGAVAYDRFPATSAIRRLYEWDPLRELVRRLLEVPVLHRYADPMGALNLAVMTEGDQLGWHFDQTDFVVSIALQSSEGGGEFECAELVREPDDEHYDRVAVVLAGDAEHRVRVVPMEPGTLLLFAGRCSLHRVSPVQGPRPRHVALLGYDTEPGTMSSEGLRKVRYGRSIAAPT